MINESGLPPPFKSVVACRPPGISRSPSGKIDGNSVPEPFWASSLRPRPSYQRAERAAKEIPKRITFADARPYRG